MPKCLQLPNGSTVIDKHVWHQEPIWRYKDAEYRKACQIIDETDWDGLLHKLRWHWLLCHQLAQQVHGNHVYLHSKTVAETQEECAMAYKEHYSTWNTAFQAARRSAKPAQYSKFRKLHNKVVKMIQNAKSSYFKNLNLRNKKPILENYKHLNKQQSTIPTLRYHDTAAESDSEKANECFSACFNRDIPLVPPADNDHHSLHFSPCPGELLCTAEKVIFLMMSLDPSNTNGPDGISVQMHKGTAQSTAPSLTKLFNISISQGHFPECWKTSSVVPIPKSVNRCEATDYRPIPCNHYPTNNGFQSGKSTVQQ